MRRCGRSGSRDSSSPTCARSDRVRAPATRTRRTLNASVLASVVSMARGFDWDKVKVEKLVTERGSERIDEPRLAEPFVPAEKRKQMRATRERLLAEFRKLPKADRARRDREFRKRLKA